MPGLFVIGTDTSVGKTVLSAALLAAMAAEGETVSAHKPALTGIDEPPASDEWPADHELLASLTGQSPEQVAPLRFGPAVSPHLAAEMAGTPIDPATLVTQARLALEQAGTGMLVIEGVGGLMVPLNHSYVLRDLARELGLSVVLAARAGLGTINHTLLTLHAARAADLDVRAVVLTPWPASPDEIERSNRQTIAELGEIEVQVLPQVASADPASLAAAGASLHWRGWLS